MNFSELHVWGKVHELYNDYERTEQLAYAQKHYSEDYEPIELVQRKRTSADNYLGLF